MTITRLHLSPGDPAGGSLRHAVAIAGTGEEVAVCMDDLSCGPIEGTDVDDRVAWWAEVYEGGIPEFGGRIANFWRRIEEASENIVVWFGRGSSCELAFLHAVADRLGTRPFSVVEIAAEAYTHFMPDGTSREVGPVSAAALVHAKHLAAMISTERLISVEEHSTLRARWHELQNENAPFRVVERGHLVSKPSDHFD